LLLNTDHECVERILAGDKSAFRQLFQENRPLVEHIVFRMIPNQADREEICQEVFLKVFENIGTFHFKSRLQTWIGRIAYNTSLNYLRKKGPELYENFLNMQADSCKESFFEMHLRSDEPLPDEYSETQDRNMTVRRLIEKLPVTYRTILTLFHIDGQNYQEIGDIMALPEGTVKSYLFRARKMLREYHEALLQGEDI